MRIISQSALEQISLEEARLQCRIDAEGSPPSHPEDPLLELLITGVRRFVERYLGVSLTTATAEIELDAFPSGNIELEGGPVLNILSIAYTDENGAEQLVDVGGYSLNTDAALPRVLLEPGSVWPLTKTVASAVRVRYAVGNTTPAESPNDQAMREDIKLAMLMIIAFLFKNRGDESLPELINSGKLPIPPAARLFLSPHIMRRRFA